MWLNEHRRGPGWKRFLSVRRQHRFLLVLLPERCGRGAPGAERLPPEDASPGASSGPWSVAPGGTGARGCQGSGAPLQGPAYPLTRRASAAAGAAPQEPPPRTVPLARAGGGGGGAGPLKSAARLPDPPAPAPLWSRLDCGKVASRLRLWLRRWTLRPQLLRLCQEPGRSIFLGPCTLDLSSFPFYFYSFHLATVM